MHFLLLAGVLLSGDRFAVDILLVNIIVSVQRYVQHVHVSIWEFNWPVNEQQRQRTTIRKLYSAAFVYLKIKKKKLYGADDRVYER